MNNLKLIIDCQSLCWKYVYDMSSLSYAKNKTGVMYGFLNRILFLAKTYQTNQFIFCWDSQQSYRKMDFPDMGYKDREHDPAKEQVIKAAREQFILLRKEVLPAIGFQNVFMVTGYEADDLIAHITIRIPGNYLIVSGDHDLYQLLRDHPKCPVKIHDVRADKIITENDFRNRYFNLDPVQWANVKAIAGCKSDKVPGIVGVGDDSAIKWIKGQLPDGKIKMKIESPEGKQTRSDCMRLVFIPYDGDRPIPYDSSHIKEDVFYSMDFMETFKKYGFVSFVNNLDDWREAFKIIRGRRN